MFEVGKKYKYYGKVYECLRVGKDRATFINILSETDVLVPHINDSKWEEYVEPKVTVDERYVFHSFIRGQFFTCKDNKTSGALGKIRITYTEGQGIAVDVID